MEIDKFSKSWKVRFLNTDDVDAVVSLCSRNQLYYQYCPPFVSRELILEEMNALPENTNRKDKYYCGFFDHGELIAVMDLISHYPDHESVFIGFFMMNVEKQKKRDRYADHNRAL